jgi:hypothetical protein
MTLKDDLKAYHARWAEVEAVIKEERRTASLELRWQQLNTAYSLARDLGLLREDPSEAGVFERWAMLKEKADSQITKVYPHFYAQFRLYKACFQNSMTGGSLLAG